MTSDEYLKLDVVEQLRLFRDNSIEMPWFIPGEYPPEMKAVLSYAITEIERLRGISQEGSERISRVMEHIESITDERKLAAALVVALGSGIKIEPTDDFAAIKRKIRGGT